MFTGATDYVETALGTMPGSFLTVSILNSALTGTWIQEFRDPGIAVLVMGLLGFILGLALGQIMQNRLIFRCHSRT
jgi:hypothetical protein